MQRQIKLASAIVCTHCSLHSRGTKHYNTIILYFPSRSRGGRVGVWATARENSSIKSVWTPTFFESLLRNSTPLHDSHNPHYPQPTKTIFNSIFAPSLNSPVLQT